MLNKSSLGKLRSVFAVGFILTISMALTSYIDSSFLDTFISKTRVGILFTVASFSSLVYIANTPKILSKFGVVGTMQATTALYVLSILGLVFLHTPILLEIFF